MKQSVADASNDSGNPQVATLKSTLLGNARQYGIYLALVVVIAIFEVLTGGRLLFPNNFVALFQQNAYVLVLAIGMLMVIIGTHIDLSVGSVVAFIGGMGAFMMKNWGLNWFLAIVLMLALGLIVGIWQGFWVAYVGVPAFVTTLGGMLVFRGLATVIAGESIPLRSREFRAISKDFLPNIFGFWFGLDGLTLVVGAVVILLVIVMQVRRRSHTIRVGLQAEPRSWMIIKCVLATLVIGFVTYLLASSGNQTQGGIPIVLVIIAVLVGIYWFVLNRMVLGRDIYAVGGNRKAAVLSGIDTRKVDFKIFLNMGLLAAIAAIITLSRLASATAQTGMEFEMDAIAACFIGGAAVAGGVGTIPGAMVGALIMGVLNQGLSIMGADAAIVKIIKGLVVIIAVAYDLISKRHKK
ncbi:sugar ABC transporter permease [Bifidobacterium sp. B4081]|uniref:multiple monosaccharide ABC transporter permease n=1 Tax=unclassified Bifidobacterium TaxID=2608897 RepID=UPI002269E949|nr:MULTISPECIES: multiple monosaccharide ABC transporter permease [unclassified Bifidobacterium]MCX8644962.1 sugar ABC transporter permease [Bifidobacterium sp. B4077]MCX8646771.1 sugar ABC transporter permease [Bifidobacterium sp. B4081]MCX8667853.1 sugar ABC transporter permease [Bifidobacterium sp. B3998]